MPDINRNLMSISALNDDSQKLVFKKEGAVVLKEGQLMTIKKARGVYSVIVIMSLTLDLLLSLTPSTSASKWLQENGPFKSGVCAFTIKSSKTGLLNQIREEETL